MISIVGLYSMDHEGLTENITFTSTLQLGK